MEATTAKTEAAATGETGAATIDDLVGGNQALVDFMKHAVLRGCKGADVELALDDDFRVRVRHTEDAHALTIYVGGIGRKVSVPTAKALITVLQAFVDSQSGGGVS